MGKKAFGLKCLGPEYSWVPEKIWSLKNCEVQKEIKSNILSSENSYYQKNLVKEIFGQKNILGQKKNLNKKD